ncbi:MAG TPA: O-antigen ligase family protein [Solirubrobacteraceae bacterium]
MSAPTATAEPGAADPLQGAANAGATNYTDGWDSAQQRPGLVRAAGSLSTPAITLGVAGLLCLIVFYAEGGPNAVNPRPMTTLEMALTLASGAVVASVVAMRRFRGPAYGLWPAGLLLAFAALCALSVVWSVQPDESWQNASQMLAYSALFAAAVALAHAARAHWSALLGGVLLAAVVVCGYALLTKVAPASLDSSDPYARLRAPYGYWNAIGLTAAMGVLACMWLGARRAGHALLSALSYPAMGLLLVTLMLAYSRGSLVAVGLGLALWLCVVPLRLRGATLLLVGGVGAAGVVAWTFSQPALSSDKVALAQRVDAGGQLGVVLAVMLVALTAVGVAIGFATNRHAPRPVTRRRMGAIALSLPLIALVGLVGLLAHSQRGLTGSISHDVSALTDPNAAVPLNTPGRLTSVGSVRARYWNEALEVFSEHPVLGAGADGYATARLRHRTVPLDVHHAHGFIVQTLADLGLVGLALILALLATWLAAAGRATHPFNRRWQNWRWRRIQAPYTPERIGLLSMLCVVLTFGIHSLVDWTWYFPGDACVALLCAGWLAGRGPLNGDAALPVTEQRDTTARSAQDPQIAPWWRNPSPRLALAAAVLVCSLLAVWAQWQPLRSFDAANDASALLSHDPRGARRAAQQAVNRDPLSVQALFTLAAVQQNSGESAQARATLQRAVRLQPSNPQTWVALGEYDLQARDAANALNELRAAIYLNPQTIAPEATIIDNPGLLSVRNDYLLALRETGAKP